MEYFLPYNHNNGIFFASIVVYLLLMVFPIDPCIKRSQKSFLDDGSIIGIYYFNFLQCGEFQSRLNTSTNSVRKSCLGICPASFSVDSKANPIPAVLV